MQETSRPSDENPFALTAEERYVLDRLFEMTGRPRLGDPVSADDLASARRLVAATRRSVFKRYGRRY